MVVVFGASSGIGRLTALRFAQEGAQVVVAARDGAALQSLVEEIEAAGGVAKSMAADARSAADVELVAQFCMEEFGRIATWAHVAGAGLYAKLTDTSPAEFQAIFETNLLGTAHAILAAIPRLKLGGGAFIAVSSVEGVVAIPYQGAYAASKFGVIGLMETLRREMMIESAPVSVTTVMPMGINTPFFAAAPSKIGSHPMPTPPFYKVEVVAELMLQAAKNPVRDLVAGDAGYVFWWLQKLTPRLVDFFMAQSSTKSRQSTGEFKSPNAPSLLDGPVGSNTVEGDLPAQTKLPALGIGPLNWLDLNPKFKIGAQIGVLGLAFLFLRRK